jgi:hypothetical protein
MTFEQVIEGMGIHYERSEQGSPEPLAQQYGILRSGKRLFGTIDVYQDILYRTIHRSLLFT